MANLTDLRSVETRSAPKAADPRHPVPDPTPASTPADPALTGPVHLVGVGGVGMSAVARILLARGVAVSGSDARDTPALAELRALGATVHVGHDAAHLGDARVVVVTGALAEDNPEVRRARDLGLPVRHRASVLAAVMAGRRSVAVAGTVGKTSTTAMLATVARGCGLDPSFAVGGTLVETGTNAHHGAGDLFVAEADESDSSFLQLSPTAAVVTNIGAEDHLEAHGTPADYHHAFERFTDRLPAGGLLVASADDPGAGRLARRARDRLTVRTFGESPDADLRLRDVHVGPRGTRYQATLDGRALPPVRLSTPGRHMALNSAGALLAAVELGLPADRAAAALAGYQGVQRRFWFRGEAGGVRVFDDYANYPTKVRAQLQAARAVTGSGRLVVAFQPSLFTSTRRFATEFGAALGLADTVMVLDVSRAREKPIPGVTGELIAREVPLPPDRVTYCHHRPAAAERLAGLVSPGDLVLTMGSGDVTRLGPELLALLARAEG